MRSEEDSKGQQVVQGIWLREFSSHKKTEEVVIILIILGMEKLRFVEISLRKTT